MRKDSRGRAEFLAEFQTSAVHIGDKNARTSRDPQGLLKQKPDRPAPTTSAVSLGMNGCERNGVKGDGNGFKQRGFCKGKIVRQAINDAGGNGNEFGKGSGASVIAAGNAENLTVVAEIDVAAAAVSRIRRNRSWSRR